MCVMRFVKFMELTGLCFEHLRGQRRLRAGKERRRLVHLDQLGKAGSILPKCCLPECCLPKRDW